MEQPLLSNKEQYPTEEIIFSHIGRAKTRWISFFNFIHSEHPDFKEEWRYYNDGKSWLMKVTRKSKTIFWLTIIKNTFKITFYLTDRAEEAVINSKISDVLKEQFKNGKHYGKIRGLTIVLKNKKDVEYAKEMIDLKLKIK